MTQSLISIAQEPPFWQYTDEDGLPSMTIYQILQDQKGFIWLGTANGICRFDGNEFQRFDTALFSDSEILKLQEDEKGRIWFSNLSGQLGYIENEETIKFNPENFMGKGKIVDFQLLPGGTQVVALKENYEVRFFVFKNKVRQAENFLKDFKFMGIGYLSKSFNGNIFFSGIQRKNLHSSFSIYSLDKNNYEINKLNSTASFSTKTFYQAVSIDEDNRILFFTENMYLSTSDSFEKIEKNFGHIKNIAKIDNEVYVLTENGIHLFDSLSNTDTKNSKHILKKYSANWIIKDKENNYWVSTDGEGLFPYTKYQK